MHFWVTGAAGQIGSALVERVLKEGHDVTAFQRRPNASSEYRVIVWDLAHDLDLDPHLPNPDVVVHLAAQTSSYVARKNIAIDADANVVGFARLLEAIRLRRIAPLVVLAGSATELSPDESGITRSGCPDRPLSFYDVAKCSQRSYMRQCVREGWFRGASLLLSNVYGGSLSLVAHRGFLNRCIANAARGESLEFFLGVRNLRDYIHVDDVVQAIMRLALTGGSIDYQQLIVATGRSVPIQFAQSEIARQVHERLGLQVKVEGVRAPASTQQIEYRDDVLDIDLTKSLLNWIPEISLESGIARLLNSSTLNPGR